MSARAQRRVVKTKEEVKERVKASLNDVVSNYETSAKAEKKHVERYKESYNQVNSRISTLENKVSEAQKKFKDLEKKLTSASQDYNIQMEALNEKITAATTLERKLKHHKLEAIEKAAKVVINVDAKDMPSPDVIPEGSSLLSSEIVPALEQTISSDVPTTESSFENPLDSV
uniref:Uncharacterized protein n=1 Tax=Cannabis sativa TaxID=3483 RepID=A0A803PRV0_CANSA